MESGSSNALQVNIYFPEKGYTISKDDKVLIKVSNWAFKNDKLVEGETEDVVTFLGSSKNKKVWDSALNGMRKLSRRAILYRDGSNVIACIVALEKVKKNGAIQKTVEEQPKTETPINSSPIRDGKKEDLMQRVAKLGVQMPVLSTGQQEEPQPHEVDPVYADQHRSVVPPNQNVHGNTMNSGVHGYPDQSHGQTYPPHPYPSYQSQIMHNPHTGYNQPHQPHQPHHPHIHNLNNPYNVHPYQQPQYQPYQQPPQPNQLALAYPQPPPNNFSYQGQHVPQQQPPQQLPPINVIAQMPPVTVEDNRQPRKEKRKSEKKEDKSVPITAETIQLMFEEKQLKSDIKVILDNICGKLDEIITKLDNTIFTNTREVLPGISGKMLLQSIERVVIENETMTNEVGSRNLSEFDLIDSDSDSDL